MKKYLLTGLLVWVPLGITIWVLDLTISTLDQSLLLLPVNWYPDKLLGIHIPGLGVILTVVIVLGTGLLVHNVLGQRLLSYWEGLLRRIPVVSSIYHSVKQVSDTLLSSNGLAFRKVLLVRYPHPDAWSLAFQTAIPGEVTQQLQDEYVGVFIPTAPSPVNGFYFYVRRTDTIELNISVDVALKSIISMGVVATPATPYQPEN
ncbi:MAG: putative membrane protein [Candidatus Nitrotoga sp. LAW]|nr:MAG: putative membrane protein [Candidatus Nitrotoga sp. LAW]